MFFLFEQFLKIHALEFCVNGHYVPMELFQRQSLGTAVQVVHQKQSSNVNSYPKNRLSHNDHLVIFKNRKKKKKRNRNVIERHCTSCTTIRMNFIHMMDMQRRKQKKNAIKMSMKNQFEDITLETSHPSIAHGQLYLMPMPQRFQKKSR